ncbi:TraB/GumN family protein, partial [Escherichia coli]
TQLAELTRLADETGVSLSMLDTLPLWQIAMVLQATQAQRLGLRGDYGIDYQLLNAARARNLSVIELEGTDSQIALLR